jgi:hypothetical protein
MAPVSECPDIAVSSVEKAITSPESQTLWTLSASTDDVCSVQMRDVSTAYTYSHILQECDAPSTDTNQSTPLLDHGLPEHQYQAAVRRASHGLYWSTVVALTTCRV